MWYIDGVDTHQAVMTTRAPAVLTNPLKVNGVVWNSMDSANHDGVSSNLWPHYNSSPRTSSFGTSFRFISQARMKISSTMMMMSHISPITIQFQLVDLIFPLQLGNARERSVSGSWSIYFRHLQIYFVTCHFHPVIEHPFQTMNVFIELIAER